MSVEEVTQKRRTGTFEVRKMIYTFHAKKNDRAVEWLKDQMRQEINDAIMDAISDGRCYTVIVGEVTLYSENEFNTTYEKKSTVLLTNLEEAQVGEDVLAAALPKFPPGLTELQIMLADGSMATFRYRTPYSWERVR